MKLSENEIRDINKYLMAGKPLPEKYRFLLFDDQREVELVWNGKSKIFVDHDQVLKISKDKDGIVIREVLVKKWTGDYVFENEWQSFRTKKDRSLELISAYHECENSRHKIAVKVVDNFGNDTMNIIGVMI